MPVRRHQKLRCVYDKLPVPLLGDVGRRVRSPTSNVSCYNQLFTFRDVRSAQAAVRAPPGVIVRPVEDVWGNIRAARCLGVMGSAYVYFALQWEVLICVLHRTSVCNILAGTSLMQRQLVIFATKTHLRCLPALR